MLRTIWWTRGMETGLRLTLTDSADCGGCPEEQDRLRLAQKSDIANAVSFGKLAERLRRCTDRGRLFKCSLNHAHCQRARR